VSFIFGAKFAANVTDDVFKNGIVVHKDLNVTHAVAEYLVTSA